MVMENFSSLNTPKPHHKEEDLKVLTKRRKNILEMKVPLLSRSKAVYFETGVCGQSLEFFCPMSRFVSTLSVIFVVILHPIHVVFQFVCSVKNLTKLPGFLIFSCKVVGHHDFYIDFVVSVLFAIFQNKKEEAIADCTEGKLVH